MIWVSQTFANNSVVVDFSVDSKCNAIIVVGKWLGTTVNAYDAQSFMGKNCKMSVLTLQYRIKH